MEKTLSIEKTLLIEKTLSWEDMVAKAVGEGESSADYLNA